MTNPNKAGDAGQAAALPDDSRQAAGLVPSPVELLSLLDGWISKAGADANHPWRKSIAATLSAQPEAWRPAAPPTGLVELCDDIALQASDLLRLLDGPEPLRYRLSVRAVVAQIGWMADTLTTRLDPGVTGVRGDARAWLLREGE